MPASVLIARPQLVPMYTRWGLRRSMAIPKADSSAWSASFAQNPGGGMAVRGRVQVSPPSPLTLMPDCEAVRPS
jgi:hypothetical protein